MIAYIVLCVICYLGLGVLVVAAANAWYPIGGSDSGKRELAITALIWPVFLVYASIIGSVIIIADFIEKLPSPLVMLGSLIEKLSSHLEFRGKG